MEPLAKSQVPNADDRIGNIRIIAGIVAGILLGYLGLIGGIPLFSSFLIVGFIGVLYSNRVLNIASTKEDGITLINAMGINGFQVLCTIIVSWTLVHNVLHVDKSV